MGTFFAFEKITANPRFDSCDAESRMTIENASHLIMANPDQIGDLVVEIAEPIFPGAGTELLEYIDLSH